MAALQCCKNVFIINKFRIINTNYLFQQSVRRKHIGLVLLNLKKPHNYHKRLRFLSSDLNNLCRYSSTNSVVNDQAGKFSNSTNLDVSNDKTSLEEGENYLPEDKNIVIDESMLPAIPTPPGESISPDAVKSVVDFLETGLKEPTLASLGLTSWWPPGLIRQAIELLHINHDLPWWVAIAVVTVGLRLLIFPLNMKSRRDAINIENNLPQLQHLQNKISEAKETGNYFDAALHMQELHKFINEKQIATAGLMLPMIAQTPIFLSMYWALRKMTDLPVESMKTGGILWFTDLTIPDPYYILPIFICGTMYAVIASGIEGNSPKSMQSIWLKSFTKVLPFLTLPITIHFPAALQCYWTVSNGVALTQVLIMKIPIVRKWGKLPNKIIHDPAIFRTKKTGISGFKESLQNMKLIKEIADRERLNTVTFEKAGIQPTPRTFKQNPKNFNETK